MDAGNLQQISAAFGCNPSYILMKLCLLLAGLLVAGLVRAQSQSFEQTVEVIKKNIRCCSVPFSPSTTAKVEDIRISKNGTITLVYNGNRPKQTFNIFKLYEETATATGIDTILGGKFIQFYVNEQRIRLIRFSSREKTSEVFAAFQALLSICDSRASAVDSNRLSREVNFINNKLDRRSESGNISISAYGNGDVVIRDKGKQTFRFNFHTSASRAKLVYCDKKLHAPVAWINFYQEDKITAFIRFKCQVPNDELENIQQAFTLLQSSLTPNNNAID